MPKMKKVNAKKADQVAQAIVQTLEQQTPYIHTITTDKAKQFANHQQVAEQLSMDYYFAKPYHCWEIGVNENLNGLVRQYFKKSTDFSNLTEQQIRPV